MGIKMREDRPRPMFDFIDDAEREYWSERAAVLEYDGEMSRADAEAMAFEELKRKRNECNGSAT